MKLPQSDLSRLQRNVEKQMFELRRLMERYRSLEIGLRNYRDRFNDFNLRFSFTKPELADIVVLEKVAANYHETDSNRFRLMRNIDNTSAIIAGSLAVAIDICMEEYSLPLKHWIGRVINQMARLREVENDYVDIAEFFFPSATAILTPYLYKTLSYSVPKQFALVRNAIRELIYI